MKQMNIDFVFKTPQQVSGVVFRQPNGGKFTNPQMVMVSVKQENGSYKKAASQSIFFDPKHDVKFEHRRKIFAAQWGKEVRVTMISKRRSKIAMGGKFDLLLAKESL